MSKPSSVLLTSKYFQTIDELPVFNWWQIHKTGDLSYLLESRRKISNREANKLILTWKKIYDDFLEKFGFSEEFLSILRKKINIAVMRAEMAENKDRSMLTLIEIEELELEQMTKPGEQKEVDFFDIKAIVEARMGFKLDIKTCTVAEFYTYMKLVRKNGKKGN